MLDALASEVRGESFVRVALGSLAAPGPTPAGWTRRVLVIAAICVGASVATFAFSAIVHGDPAFSFGEHRLGTIASVAMLGACALAAWRTARRLGIDPFARLWRIGAVSLAFFAVDDYFMIHENVDYGIHWLLGRDPKDPITDPIDDVIVMTYPLIGAVAAWPFRRDLAALPWMLWSIVAAMVLFASMAAIDWFEASPILEESLKIGAGGAILAAILAAEGYLLDERSSR